MREIVKTIKVYKFGECKKVDEKIKERLSYDPYYGEWVLNYGEWVLMKSIDTLRAFAKTMGFGFDYCISLVPDRGEFINFKVNGEIDHGKLQSLINDKDNCPLTGMGYDYDFLELVENQGIRGACISFLDNIHN